MTIGGANSNPSTIKNLKTHNIMGSDQKNGLIKIVDMQSVAPYQGP